MPKRKTTKRKRRPTSYGSMNQALKTVNQGMQATVALGALGITATTVTKIAKP